MKTKRSTETRAQDKPGFPLRAKALLSSSALGKENKRVTDPLAYFVYGKRPHLINLSADRFYRFLIASPVPQLYLSFIHHNFKKKKRQIPPHLHTNSTSMRCSNSIERRVLPDPSISSTRTEIAWTKSLGHRVRTRTPSKNAAHSQNPSLPAQFPNLHCQLPSISGAYATFVSLSANLGESRCRLENRLN